MKKHLSLYFLLFLLVACSNPLRNYSWEDDLNYRLQVDFSWTQQQVKDYIQKYIPDVTDEQIDAWTQAGVLESMMLNGERRYFNRTAANLFRVDSTAKAIKKAQQPQPTTIGALDSVLLENIQAVYNHADSVAVTKRFRVKYTLTVQADAVPQGEIIRCWLPYPQDIAPRQTNIKLLHTSHKPVLSADVCPSKKMAGKLTKNDHATLYMQAIAEKSKPTIFSEEFEYTARGVYNTLNINKIKPYDTSSATYQLYTQEREAHIIFTPRLRALADSLTQGLTHPLEQAQAIYMWVDKTFPWAGAMEYSTLANIPEYVLESGHGDCGQVALLFITLCRIVGIPAHFQSGFWVQPNDEGMHDWAEIYFEGVGWVPVDQSYGPTRFDESSPLLTPYLQEMSGNYFYLGGMDNFRLIVNQDFGQELYPSKLYPRSETVDFQRGEVEWRNGNIYFPDWDYEIQVTEIE